VTDGEVYAEKMIRKKKIDRLEAQHAGAVDALVEIANGSRWTPIQMRGHAVAALEAMGIDPYAERGSRPMGDIERDYDHWLCRRCESVDGPLTSDGRCDICLTDDGDDGDVIGLVPDQPRTVRVLERIRDHADSADDPALLAQAELDRLGRG